MELKINKKISLLIFSILLLSGLAYAVSPLPVIYGTAFFGNGSADGCVVRAYPQNNVADLLNDTVGPTGNFALSGWWKINLNNFQSVLDEGDVVVVNSSCVVCSSNDGGASEGGGGGSGGGCGGAATVRYYTVNAGDGTKNLSLNFDPAYQDYDGDGSYAVNDCNDNDPSIYPGATEIADGKDNDCDGSVDEGTGGTSDRGGSPGGGGGGGGTCTPNWQCTEWSNCQPDGKSTRTCSEDLNKCGEEKPSEERACFYSAAKEEEAEETQPAGVGEQPAGAAEQPVTEPAEEPTGGLAAVTGAVIGALGNAGIGGIIIFVIIISALLIAVFYYRKKRKD